jgi:hypothetical protein
MKTPRSLISIPVLALVAACGNSTSAQDPSITQTMSAETHNAQSAAPVDPSGGKAGGTDVYTNRMDRLVETAPLPIANDSAAFGAVTGSSPGAMQRTTRKAARCPNKIGATARKSPERSASTCAVSMGSLGTRGRCRRSGAGARSIRSVRARG